MNILKNERATLDRLLPGLDAQLTTVSLMTLESRGSPAFAAFRAAGGAGLLIPAGLGGIGAKALDALRVQIAIASRSPSLAVATAMHHFTIVCLVALNDGNPGAESELLSEVAQERLLIASGFAEGRSGASIQTSAMHVERDGDVYLVSGSKKPCSLAASMDLFCFSVPAPEGMDAGLAAAIVPATSPGLSRRPFWNSPILAGAESDEIILDKVRVPIDTLAPLGGSGRASPVQDAGFFWFEMLITAVYVGAAARLLERVFESGKGEPVARVQLATEIEGARAGLENMARGAFDENSGGAGLARMLLVRFAAQNALERANSLAIEILGGQAFIASPEVSYLAATSRALSLHPPSRLAVSPRLDRHLSGETFVVD